MAAQLKFIEEADKHACDQCLFCLKSSMVDADFDYGHEPCALEVTENGWPDALWCFPVSPKSEGRGRTDGKRGYWTI